MKLNPPVRARLFAVLVIAALSVCQAVAAVYEVGPGKPLATIGAVPWATLQPGDTVLIHWKAAPYKEKWVIARQGTAPAPITVRGVPGPAGELPVIDGQNAVTAPGLNYWSETRGVVKIGGSSTPPDTMPRHILIENLAFINAHTPFQFTDDGGATQSYSSNASGIYVEKGENITIRNCEFRNNGNGLFVASSDATPSRNILIQGNYIHSNGNVGSVYEHNSYTAAIGITFEHNRYGPLLSGAGGNNLKDRSAGMVVRYNWIEGGNRQLDLVDGEDSSLIRNDPSYRQTYVYGNVLIEPAGAGNRQILHYGGDSGTTSAYRKGTLYLYSNTIVSTRTDRTTLMRLSTNDERCDARNNVFYTTLPGSDLSMLDSSGILDLSHNWVKPGWVATFGGLSGVINNDGTMVQGASPGFINEAGQDFHLAAGSANIDAGTALHPSIPVAHNVARQYIKHQTSEPRPVSGASDIGAFEVQSGANQPPSAVIAANPTSGNASLTVGFDGSGSSDSDGFITAYVWNFGDGGSATGVNASHTFINPGNYSASLTVTDDDNATAQATIGIVATANTLAPPVLSGAANGSVAALSWTNPGADGFELQRGTRKKGTTTWTTIATLNSAQTAYQDQPGRGNFYYRVRAYRGSGASIEYSGYSNEVQLSLSRPRGGGRSRN